MTLPSSTSGLEPVSCWLLGVPYHPAPADDARSPFGVAFIAWRRERGLSLQRAAALLGVSDSTIHAWGVREFPARRYWPTLAARAVDPAPFYRPPWRAPRRPEAERRAMGRAFATWLDSNVDVAVELDVTDQTIKNWRAGACTPTTTNRDELRRLGFVWAVAL